MQTTIAKSKLPAGLAKAVAALNPKGLDVKIEAREQQIPSTDSQVYTVVNALVLDLDDPASVTVRRGVWGGNNGFNKPPADSTWDPVFDRERRDVPRNGAILVGTVGRYCWIAVHPEAFAIRFVTHDVVRDALLEGRTEDASAILASEHALTDEECAILYVHGCLKSCDTRKQAVAKYATALEACVARGLIRRSKNGACAITTEGKAMYDAFRRRGEKVCYSIR